jgi:hypothetical protein
MQLDRDGGSNLVGAEDHREWKRKIGAHARVTPVSGFVGEARAGPQSVSEDWKKCKSRSPDLTRLFEPRSSFCEAYRCFRNSAVTTMSQS